MLLDAEDSQLVLVDYQLRLMPAIFENQQVIANAVRLARLAASMTKKPTGSGRASGREAVVLG